MALELRDDAAAADLDQLRHNLNRHYDGFTRKHGYINALGNRQAMKDDPEWPLLSSLERDYDPGISRETAQKTGQEARLPFAAKADIFRQRVLGPRRQITHVESSKEALIVSMNEFGKPDLEFMENICGMSADDISADLAGLIYFNPDGRAWELADHYLTGNVKEKLAQAAVAAMKDIRFQANA